jgi:hypothetical protein
MNTDIKSNTKKHLKTHYKPKPINVIKLKIYLESKSTNDRLKRHSTSSLANSTAIGLSITEANQYLTLISLVLAISFTIYKFYNYETKK